MYLYIKLSFHENKKTACYRNDDIATLVHFTSHSEFRLFHFSKDDGNESVANSIQFKIDVTCNEDLLIWILIALYGNIPQGRGLTRPVIFDKISLLLLFAEDRSGFFVSAVNQRILFKENHPSKH